VDNSPSQILLLGKLLLPIYLDKFDPMINRLSRRCFHIGTYIKPWSSTALGYALGSYRCSGL